MLKIDLMFLEIAENRRSYANGSGNPRQTSDFKGTVTISLHA